MFVRKIEAARSSLVFTALWLCLGMIGLAVPRPAVAQGSAHWLASPSATNLSGTTFVLWTKAGTTDGNGNYSGDQASVWAVDATGHETAIGPTYGPYPGWYAMQISPGQDGTCALFWNKPDSSGSNGQASVWHLDGAGHRLSIGPTYGPYAGWNPAHVQAQSDGTSALYWTNTTTGDQQVSIWTVDASGNRLAISPTYGPYAGWAAVGVSPSLNKDGSVFLSWVHSGDSNGSGSYSGDQLSLWKTDARGKRISTSPTYGPYAGWRFSSLASAYDGTARLLWTVYGATDTHGTYAGDRISLWDVGSQGNNISISPTYGPFAGWSAVNMTVARDNTLRLQWTHQLASAFDGTYSSTTVSNGTTYTNSATVSNGAVTGHGSFNTGSQSGFTDWQGTVTPSASPYDDATITGSGTINNQGTRSFTLTNGGIALDQDGTVRLYWQGNDPVFGGIGGSAVRQTPAPQSVSLWALDASGHLGAVSPTYGPYTGWSAGNSLTALPDGTERLFWDYGNNYANNNGSNNQGTKFSVWSLNSSNGSPTIGPSYGPFP